VQPFNSAHLQGDGTAEILKDEPDLFTMSMHCADNFPLGFYQVQSQNHSAHLPYLRGVRKDAHGVIIVLYFV
jgi:acetoin utilization deacetylase AcuC-like enzyme